MSPESLEAISPRAKVVGWIRDAIESGRLGTGMPVPSERKLAAKLSVSRPTVRAAFEDLARLGLLDRSGGGRIRRVGHVPAEGSYVPAVLSRSVLLLSDKRLFDRQPVPNSDTAFVTGLIARIAEDGRSALVVNPLEKLSTVEELIRGRPAGAILTYGVSELEQGRRLATALTTAGVPTVVYGDAPGLEQFDSVRSDHEGGAYELARLLMARGCRRILRFWCFPQEHPWVELRNKGFERAIAEAGLELLPPVRTPSLDGFESFPLRARAMAGFLGEHVLGPNPVDGLMLATDIHALEAGAALALLGRQPGKDVKLVGYDNAWRFWKAQLHDAAQAPAPLATVDKQHDIVTRTIIEMLSRRIDGRTTGPESAVISGKVIETENE